MQDAAVSTDTAACSGWQPLPFLKLISGGIVAVQVLICDRASKKSWVHRGSDPNHRVLVSALGGGDAVGAELQGTDTLLTVQVEGQVVQFSAAALSLEAFFEYLLGEEQPSAHSICYE